ncbi:MAG TPA: hypothetical protein VGW76_14860 [Pyrinomonadaceae bacterium]|nr:hypothetical protein [Pyrinomonadaceae bacterium]
MNKTENAQTLGGREIVASLDREFARLFHKSCAVIESTPSENLYAPAPHETATATTSDVPQPTSIGENVLRAAAAIEQTFGGITANLWDDPFEWTLPEYLATPARVLGYLTEVEETRRRAFTSFTDDGCLLKQVAVPSGETPPLIDLLRSTLMRAAAYLGQETKCPEHSFRD